MKFYSCRGNCHYETVAVLFIIIIIFFKSIFENIFTAHIGNKIRHFLLVMLNYSITLIHLLSPWQIAVIFEMTHYFFNTKYHKNQVETLRKEMNLFSMRTFTLGEEFHYCLALL